MNDMTPNDLMEMEDQNNPSISKSNFSAGLDTLSGSEAVYGLLAWLTCRDEAVTFSAKHNANIAAELAKQFCEENNLADPKDDYHTRLITSGRKRNTKKTSRLLAVCVD